jgi:copper(I)-binding protein
MFAHVEMHETTIEQGIARMNRLTSLTLGPGTRAEFSAGGKHVMLLQPHDRLHAGDVLSIDFAYGDGENLMLEAPLRARRLN